MGIVLNQAFCKADFTVKVDSSATVCRGVVMRSSKEDY